MISFRVVSRSRFIRHFGSHDESSKQRERRVIKTLTGFLWPKGENDVKFRVLSASGCLLLSKVATVQAPVLLGGLVNSLAAHTTVSNAAYLLPASIAPFIPASTFLPAIPLALLTSYGLARISSSLFNELRTALFARVAQNACRAMALKAFKSVHSTDLQTLQEMKAGELQSVLNRGVKSVSGILSMVLFMGLPTLLEFGLVLGILGSVGGLQTAALAAATMTGYTMFTTRFSEIRTKYRQGMNSAESSANSLLLDSITNAEAVKSFTNENFESQRYDKAYGRYEEANVRVAESLGLLNFGQQAIFNTGLLAILGITANSVVNGIMPIGDLVTVSTLLFQLSVPANFLGTVYRETKMNLVDFEKLDELLKKYDNRNAKIKLPEMIVKEGSISLRSINFNAGGRDILSNLSLDIPSGSIVGIVGASGSGKSSLLKLINRLCEPTSGSILIDGVNVSEHSPESVRKAIAMVPQDCVLFHASIADNIRYGKPEATDEEVVQAAKAAAVDEIIQRMPLGYNTLVGERGMKLSGGERQRVGIARCMLKNSRIVLFDEATSALDSATEAQILKGFQALAKGRTAVMVAHRLSTLRSADKIFFIEDGKVAESGTHDQLVNLPGGRYRALWVQQFSESEH